MKLLIWGIANYYINRERELQELLGKDKIIAFVDKRADEIESFESLPVVSPEKIDELEFDQIILMSSYREEMKQQLLYNNIPEKKIICWEDFVRKKSHGKLQLFVAKKQEKGRRVLIISHCLDYTGGAMAALYAALALKQKGYQVCVTSENGNQVFIEEAVGMGINIILCPSILYLDKEELFWIQLFDTVLVNVFPMLPCACEVSKYKPVLWWIHENSSRYDTVYGTVRKEFPQYTIEKMQKVKVAAVSRIAQRNFEEYYPNKVSDILPFGIPDEAEACDDRKKSGKLVFAVIGGVFERKAQKEFVQAVNMLDAEQLGKSEFWMIGSYSKEDSYYKETAEIAGHIPQIKWLGKLTRKEMQETFRDIDVVVCPSLEETMSIAVVEGMMHRKVCVTTDATGIADYIIHGENGFICEAGSVKSLLRIIKKIIDNEFKMKLIRKAARKTYEEYFTLEKFGDRLEELICLTQTENTR